MKYLFYLLLLVFLADSAYSIEPAGQWTFNNAEEIEKADYGNDLILVGDRALHFSDELNKHYISIGLGSYFRCIHNLEKKNGESGINEYSLVFDFRVSVSGRYYCFYQTNTDNQNDGEVFISPTLKIGITGTKYSDNSILLDNWYRLIVNVKNGEFFDYYLDGDLLLSGNVQTIDSRFALSVDEVLFFADENNEDNEIDISRISIYDRALTPDEIKQLGGFEHKKYKELLPFLQAPTDSSIYICWHNSADFVSKVEYHKLGDNQVNEVIPGFIVQDETTYWYTALLRNLEPNTEYIYKCYSGDLVSQEYSFVSYPKQNTANSKIRIVLMSDCQTHYLKSDSITSAVKNKLIELYGADYYKNVNLIFLTGDIIGNGDDLQSYQTEFFKPFAKLSSSIPIMSCIGNHENESQFYYNYMTTLQFAGPESNRYYKFNCGPVSIFALNTIWAKNTQLDWFTNGIEQEQDKDNTLFILSMMHYPAKSEIWPFGNSYWVDYYLNPILMGAKKSVLRAGGHSHCYERGALIDSGNTYSLTIGGAGGALDRWGAYSNQTNYSEIQKSIDVYHWVLMDIDLLDSSFTLSAYSLGNYDKPAYNELIDRVRYKVKDEPNKMIEIIEPKGNTGIPLNIKTRYPIDIDSIYCVQVRISEYEDMSIHIIDTMICLEDYYLNTGFPDYFPININANVNLADYNINGEFQYNTDYYYTVRYRDNLLNWSLYSEPVRFQIHAADIISDEEFSLRYIGQETNVLEIICPSPQSFRIMITDLLGRNISEDLIDLQAGTNHYKLNHSLQGIFYVSLDYANGMKRKYLKIFR